MRGEVQDCTERGRQGWLHPVRVKVTWSLLTRWMNHHWCLTSVGLPCAHAIIPPPSHCSLQQLHLSFHVHHLVELISSVLWLSCVQLSV